MLGAGLGMGAAHGHVAQGVAALAVTAAGVTVAAAILLPRVATMGAAGRLASELRVLA